MFIVIEGLDGSGKTTASAALARRLRNRQKHVKRTMEPNTKTVGGRYIRDVLSKKITQFSHKTLALGFAANRLDHCDRIINPWTSQSDDHIILCDRYYLSSLVYQTTETMSKDGIMSLNNEARKPDIIFFFNVTAEICHQRMSKRNKPLELFEKDFDQTKAKYLDGIDYLRKTNQENIIEIDASKSVREIVDEMLGHIL